MTSSKVLPLTLHFGSGESWTTAEHFRRAAGAGPRIWEDAHGSHRYLNSLSASEHYLWVESGRSSYPLDSHLSPATTAGYLIDVHRHPSLSGLQAKLFDVAFVAQRDHITALEAQHSCVQWLPLAAPKSFLHLSRQDRYDIAFVGNTTGRSSRIRLLETLAASQLFRMNEWWRFHTPEEMGQVYAQTRIVLNIPVAGDLNMRFFEGMAAGSAVLQPPIANGVQRIATPGKHFIESAVFDHPHMLVAETANLLRTDRPERVGEAARQLIAQSHTYEHRLDTVRQVMNDLAGKVAPVRGFGRADNRRHWAELSRTTGDAGIIMHVLRKFPEVALRHPAYLGRASLLAFRHNLAART